MKQVARILADYGGFLRGNLYLIHDRDSLYNTAGFHDILRGSGIEIDDSAGITCIERLPSKIETQITIPLLSC